MWNDAVGYETYVGHWSRAIAPQFLDWLELPCGLRWLDVACGTGALTSSIVDCCHPDEVVSVDTSPYYLEFAQNSCRDLRVHFVVGDAHVLSFPASSFDVSVCALALNFISFDRALAEQHRVVRPGDTIAAYVWDYAGQYEFARRFWEAALSIDPRAADYDPDRKAKICREPSLQQALSVDRLLFGNSWTHRCRRKPPRKYRSGTSERAVKACNPENTGKRAHAAFGVCSARARENRCAPALFQVIK